VRALFISHASIKYKFIDNFTRVLIMIFIARLMNTILSIIAINFINIEFMIPPVGAASTLLTTAIGVALSESFFYIFRRR